MSCYFHANFCASSSFLAGEDPGGDSSCTQVGTALNIFERMHLHTFAVLYFHILLFASQINMIKRESGSLAQLA